MKHIWSLAMSLAFVGCAADPAPDLEDPAPEHDLDGDDDGGGSGGGGSAYGCDIGVAFEGAASRLARGGMLDVDIDDVAWFPRPRQVRSSAPEILAVAQTAVGAIITGVAPGTASIEVWRCERRIASHQVTVVPVADVEVRLSYGLAGRSEPLFALAGLPGSVDQLEITCYDDQHVALPGRRAATLRFEGSVHPAAPISLGLTDGFDGVPREVVPIAIGGAGRLTATAGTLEVEIDVTTTPAPSRLELRRVTRTIFDLQVHALVVFGETDGGLPIAGLAPTFTITPEDAFSRISSDPPIRQLFLLGQPHGPVTFTVDVAGTTATLTETFP